MTNTQKMILACLGVMICLLTIFAIYKNQTNVPKELDESLKILYDIEKPIVVTKDELYGYVLKNGDILIEPEFLTASDFWNGYASVSRKEKKYEIIDKNGTTIIEVKGTKEPLYIKECALWLIDDKIYDKDLKVIFDEDSHLEYIKYGYFTYLKNDKKETGIIDKFGQKVFSWETDYISVEISESQTEANEHYAIVNDYEEKEEIVSLKNGKTIYTIDDATTKYLRQEKNNIFRVINRSESYKTDKWLYIKDGKIAFETEEEIYSLDMIAYDEDIIKIDYGQNHKNLQKESRYYFYNIDKSHYVEEPTFSDAIFEEFSLGLNYKVYEKDKKFGLKIGEDIIVEAYYDKVAFLNYDLHKYLYDFKNIEYILLERDEKTLLYDVKNKTIIKEFDSISYTKNKDSAFLTFTIYEQNGYTKKGYLIYNVLSGKQLLIDKSDEFEIYTNYITITSNDKKVAYYDVELQKVYEN